MGIQEDGGRHGPGIQPMKERNRLMPIWVLPPVSCQLHLLSCTPDLRAVGRGYGDHDVLRVQLTFE